MTDKPSISDLAGIDPDFTGGQCPEDYLDDLRSGGKVSELRAENELLRTERDGLRAGVESLRKQVRTETRRCAQQDVQIEELEAEVERLKGELEVECTAEKIQRNKAIANYAEVRRLRADLEAERLDKIRQMDISNQQLGDEVEEGERLRAQLREQHDVAEMIRQSQMGSLLSYQMEQSAEVERLRAILREHGIEDVPTLQS